MLVVHPIWARKWCMWSRRILVLVVIGLMLASVVPNDFPDDGVVTSIDRIQLDVASRRAPMPSSSRHDSSRGRAPHRSRGRSSVRGSGDNTTLSSCSQASAQDELQEWSAPSSRPHYRSSTSGILHGGISVLGRLRGRSSAEVTKFLHQADFMVKKFVFTC
jgi:hypothetical protein